MTLGKKLKMLRLERGLSLQEFANIFGLGKTTVANYERDDRKPDYEMIAKFCDFFGVSSDYLLGRTDDTRTVRVDGEELPKELRQLGVDYIEVIKEMKEKGLSPEYIKRIVDAIQSDKK